MLYLKSFPHFLSSYFISDGLLLVRNVNIWYPLLTVTGAIDYAESGAWSDSNPTVFFLFRA